jgi:hypothetical protein
MANALIKHSPEVVSACVAEVTTGKYKLQVPSADGPNELNDINLAAYAILKEALFQLTQKEAGFVGQMVRTNAVSVKQRRWLKDLFKRHIGYDFDVGYDAAVAA